MKKIMITGATAGIGRHAALYLAERGHHVVATGRRVDALDELRDEAVGLAGRLDVVRLDVTDSESIEAARVEVRRLLGGEALDVLVNNAGYGQGAPVIEATDADMRRQFDTNVFGLMAVTRAFATDMIDNRSGRIINISSIAGRITFPMVGVYHASKYAVEALSDALRMELAPFNVQVVLVEPGPIQTNFVSRLNADAESYRAKSRYARVFERTDMIERRSMAMAPGPIVISKAIEKAITARRPRARYIAPLWSHLSLKLLQLLPTFASDAVMRWMFGLNRRTLTENPSPLPLKSVA